MNRVLWPVILLAGLAAGRVVAQPPSDPTPPWEIQPEEDAATTERGLRMRVDALLREGGREEAVELLEQWQSEHGQLEVGLMRRLARLYRDLERYEDLEALITAQREDGTPLPTAELKLLAESHLAQDEIEPALAALHEIIEHDPTDPNFVRLAANTLAHYGRTQEAIDMLLEGRERLDDPYEFAQHLGTLYYEQGDWGAATREFLKVIVVAPLNVGLMRAQIVELAESSGALDEMLAEAEKIHAEHPDVPQLALVLAELRQRAGDADGAWALLEPLLSEPDLLQEIIQMAMAGLADSRLPGADSQRSLVSLRLSARMLQSLLANEVLPKSLQPRAYDTLNRTLLAILENQAFAALPEDQQTDVLSEAREVIVTMGQQFPNSQLTAAAMLRLAGIYVDVLHRPEDAIDLYRMLHVNPNAPREQVLLARIGLGRAYMAASDTAAARTLFTSLGTDPNFRAGQGRAHYYLGMLDFMGGAFETAQDRLASVAMDSPEAEYTNDSLDLALILVEQNLADSPDTTGLAHYGRALYHQQTHEVDAQLQELQEIATSSWGNLRDRARLDLARVYVARGEPDAALTTLTALVKDSPLGRFTPNALHLEGDLLMARGDAAGARAAYEQVLLEHEGYVFVDEVRDALRTLGVEDEDDQGDLP
jgi:tetratricopeptide (TPR) repeat protein